jgi:hypothetical protein
MYASRQLLRFSLPGGLFILTAALLQVGLRWAFDLDKPTPVLSAISANPAATLAGVVVIGFVLYQLYYLYQRPMRPRYFGGKRRKDLGGTILEGLDPVVLDELRTVYEAQLHLDTAAMEDSDYRRAWHEHESVVRSLLAMIETEDGEKIKDDYLLLSDTYHALGACRYVPWAIVVATLLQVVANYSSDLAAHPVKSFVLAVATLAICVAVSSACSRNRDDCWTTMTKQLRRNLRAWFTRHPDFLGPKLDAEATVAADPKLDNEAGVAAGEEARTTGEEASAA